ncbi:hypothetical protein D3C81_2122670 [compost metagenome]
MFVVVHRHTFTDTPQLATTVVMVDFCQLPGVFVEVHVALGVNVTLTRFQGAFHFPHPVQFIAGQVLIDVPGLENVGIFQRG